MEVETSMVMDLLKKHGYPPDPPPSNSRSAIGYTLILVSIAWALVNTSDAISDLKDWHGAVNPSFVGPFLKQIGTTVIAAVGGKILPS